MNSLRMALFCLALAACRDEPRDVVAPPPDQGVAAAVTVDNLHAQVGQTVRVRVEVQVPATQTFKVGSYTGRLHFDPARLAFKTENAINDGLRVANNNGATGGEIRFAGASPSGFATLVLYDGTFEVKATNYVASLQLLMEEISAAQTLTNLRPQLQVRRQVFQSRQAERP